MANGAVWIPIPPKPLSKRITFTSPFFGVLLFRPTWFRGLAFRALHVWWSGGHKASPAASLIGSCRYEGCPCLDSVKWVREISSAPRSSVTSYFGPAPNWRKGQAVPCGTFMPVRISHLLQLITLIWERFERSSMIWINRILQLPFFQVKYWI